MYVSRLKKISLLFFLLSHTLIIFLKGDNTLLFHFYFLLHLHLSLSLLAVLFFSKRLPFRALSFLFVQLSCCFSHVKSLSLSLSLGFMLYFSSFHMEDPWAKAIKFFVTLSIYKTLFLFPLELGIHYLFNKE